MRFVQQLFVWVVTVFAFLFTTLLAALIGVAFLFSEHWGHRLHRFWGCGICVLFGIRVQVEGLANLPGGGSVLAPNHQSMFDMPILATLPTDFKWVSKEQLRSVPFLGWAMRSMGTYFVTRRNATQDAGTLKGAEQGLTDGARIVIFPEGTRSRDGGLLPLKKGAFRLAENAQVPLVPIAISGSFSIATPRHLPTRWGHSVTVRIGAPLSPQKGESTEAFQTRYLAELTRLLGF
ncbi:1-acyl-sn-glycerol-3-phosphate acyltransferase [bacterium]|nr:1-acyl-sn-glycerol-3-phosphate acyltransferase [bacterium]